MKSGCAGCAPAGAWGHQREWCGVGSRRWCSGDCLCDWCISEVELAVGSILDDVLDIASVVELAEDISMSDVELAPVGDVMEIPGVADFVEVTRDIGENDVNEVDDDDGSSEENEHPVDIPDGPRRRNSYSANFKMRALRLLGQNYGNIHVRATAKKLKINKKTLRRWRE